MKFLHKIVPFIPILLLIHSCAPYKAELQKEDITFPELASIVKSKGQFWYANDSQIGVPNWQGPIKLTVQELPFNKVSYREYARYIKKSGKINSIAYLDSLPYKPKYLQLQLVDRIGFTNILNGEENNYVRNYLENDPDYKLVTSLEVTVKDSDFLLLTNADLVLLEQDAYKKMYLTVMNKGQKKELPMSNLEVFGYEVSSFCWGEDRYHHKRIKAILSGGESCPKGTYSKATKVQADQSYLKF
ncbi:hypothetical protein SB49_14135 [Sediminicola sp. YIK13]|uniref:hypothetical protein n=1 Tax=Sediminicola sp. YIK13 TaxID=1453352 RepID=UPI0007226FAD|nr:hypothetical protein [Sediminicola sp. YIK13]ALM08807.1 hypothetical protein SB49_14135 [Sediminicola sp. YIK13]